MKHINFYVLNIPKRNNLLVFEIDFMIRINFIIFVKYTKKIPFAKNDFDFL